MIRIRKSSLIAGVITTVCAAVAPTLSHAQGGASPLLSPQAQTFGKSIEEWSVLQTQFAITTDLGDGIGVSDTVGRVRLLPSSFTPDPDVEFDITVSPGTPIATAPFFVFGERYDDPNVPDDNPDDLAPFLEPIFAETTVQITLDGRVLLNATGDQLDPFRIWPAYYDEPIVYANPLPRGPGLNSVAA